mgnify:CR=1 FL=1
MVYVRTFLYYPFGQENPYISFKPRSPQTLIYEETKAFLILLFILESTGGGAGKNPGK